MTRRMRLCFLLLTSICVAMRARADENTLRQALAAKHLQLDAAKLSNLDKKITSWAELDDANQYVIAYYLDDGSDTLNPPLFIARYDRKSSEWKSASLPETGQKSVEIDDICYGSILNFTAAGGRFFLDTHINPSAGCLLVLFSDLKLEASLSGWLLAHLGEDALIYHRSEVHFAPVHPAEIAVYDLSAKRDFTIFPPKTETLIRQARSAQLAEFYKANKDWCTKNDDPCDPQSFDSELGEKVATNEAGSAVAFLISYEQIQMVQGEVQKPSGPKDVLYVYRDVNDEAKMLCREMVLEDAKSRYGTANLLDFVQPEVLAKIFGETAAK